MFDKLKEECGVFGILDYTGENVANAIYYGLCALQHRGQESAGIAVCNTGGPLGNLTCHKDMGLVTDIFTPEVLSELSGNIGIGHVRYSTTGESSIKNAQPIAINYFKGTLALVHNGNLTNIDELKGNLQENGAIFHSTTDSEIITYQIALERTKAPDIETAILRTAEKLKGGFALIVMSPQKLIGVRDPWGLKPLCLGLRNGSYVLASETCALHAIGAEFVRNIEPGEIITISGNRITGIQKLPPAKHAHCIFEYIYFARLDSAIDGINVYDARIFAGRALADSYPADADLVSGVPDSGLTAAYGYARQSGIPFEPVFYKNSYVGRTFIKPTQKERESAVQIKLNVIPGIVKDKKIVLVDDSIVRGTTIANLITMLKKAGAKEVHVRISSPPFLHPCFYGTDVPSNHQLIASSCTTKEICSRIGADSLGYLKIEDFKKMVGELPICKACFDGQYPV